MKNTKLIWLIKTFSAKEFEEFGDFVRSPFHNKLQMVAALLGVIEKHYPELNDKLIEKEKVFGQLYKNEKYNDALMRNLISRLLKLAEDYLAYKNIKADTFLIKSRLLPELSMRRQEILFQKNFRLMITLIDEIPVKGKDYYFGKFQLELLSLQYTNIMSNGVNNEGANLQNHADYLTSYFLIAITEIYLAMINEIKVFPGRKYEFRLLEEIKNHLNRNKEFYRDSVFVNLYFNSLMMLTGDDEKFYYNLKNLINKNYKYLSIQNRYDIYVLLSNYCQNEINKGKANFIREKFELLKESFNNDGQILADGTVSYIGFYTIINYALIFREFRWTENFLNENIDKVNPKYKLSTYHYCSALMEYYKGGYEKALVSLSKVKPENYSYKLQIKTLSLMIYYSLNEEVQFVFLVDSFKHFLSSNRQVSGNHKAAYTNFINFTFRLFKGKGDISNFNLKAFRKDLLENNDIAKKHWLIEKTVELEKVNQP